MKKWYSIQSSAQSGAPARISIHDEIGAWGVTARDFIRDFDSLPQDSNIELSVHSPGGSVFEALAIYHVLNRAKDRITARVEGLAASAASLIVMAASRIEMPENAYLMIHNPWAVAIGDSEAMHAMADMLDKVKGSLTAIYVRRTGKSDEEIVALLDSETWMTGAEAVASGFADAVIDAAPVSAKVSDAARAHFLKLPQALSAPEAMPADAVAAACADAGFGKLAASLIRAKATSTTVTARIGEAQEIVALAKAAGRPGDAEPMILNGLSTEVAREKLLAARASSNSGVTGQNSVTNSGFEAPEENQGDGDGKPAASINFRSIYSARQAANKPA